MIPHFLIWDSAKNAFPRLRFLPLLLEAESHNLGLGKRQTWQRIFLPGQPVEEAEYVEQDV